MSGDGSPDHAERGDGPPGLTMLVLRLRSLRIALAAASVVGGVMAMSPLLGIHGVESAVVLGIALPPFVAAAGARLVMAIRQAGRAVPASELLRAAVTAGLSVWAVPTVLLALNAVRFRQCTPALGLTFMVLGPGVGCALAAITGVFVGAMSRRPRRATTAAVLVPLAAIALGLLRLYDTPGIFSYSHFVGYAPGTIYDEGLRVPVTYVTFRFTTLAWLSGLWVLVTAGWVAAEGRWSLRRLPGAWPSAAVAVALLVVGVVADVYGPELGHRASVETMTEELGASLRGQRCTVVVPRELPRQDARRLMRDCDFRVQQIEGRLGLTQRKRITAFFFRDSDEKQRLMGAGRTYIAKPWRNEVYLQLSGWPHPVLAHELTHVIAGNAAPGPLHVSGHLGGLWPAPGLIEGTAVATAWDVRDDLTPDEWSAAMLRLGELPPVEGFLGLSFGTLPARRAYGAAGSFVHFVAEEHGARAVRLAYRDGAFEEATGQGLAQLEEAWHAHLRQVPLSDEALERARVLLTRQSIFSAVCPHRVANLRQQLAEDLAAGDDRRVRSTCGDLLEIDPLDASSRTALIGALARAGDEGSVDREMERLGDAPEAFRSAAREAVADALWRRGRPEEALAIYRELLASPLGEDQARLLEVKEIGLSAGGRQARLLLDLLVGRDTAGTPPVVAVHLAAEVERERQDGLGVYLHGRQLQNAQRYDLALPLMRRAVQLGLPTPRLQREAQRLLAIALYARHDLDGSARVFRTLARDQEAMEASRVEARDWLERIRWARSQP